jgi:hypothetical protein
MMEQIEKNISIRNKVGLDGCNNTNTRARITPIHGSIA